MPQFKMAAKTARNDLLDHNRFISWKDQFCMRTENKMVEVEQKTNSVIKT